MLQYKEAVGIQIDLGRFQTAAKLQKEIAELHEAEGDLSSVRASAREFPFLLFLLGQKTVMAHGSD